MCALPPTFDPHGEKLRSHFVHIVNYACTHISTNAIMFQSRDKLKPKTV